jgi:hypothetical protein
MWSPVIFYVSRMHNSCYSQSRKKYDISSVLTCFVSIVLQRKQRREDYDEFDHEVRQKKRRSNDNSEENAGKRRKIGTNKSKSTSLFCGNPEVPAIPKHKKSKSKQIPLFSEIDFANAGIHPYMVSVHTWV